MRSCRVASDADQPEPTGTDARRVQIASGLTRNVCEVSTDFCARFDRIKVDMPDNSR